jgi:hypothetical protein
MTILWRGASDGALVIRNDREHVLTNAGELASYISTHSNSLQPPLLRILGSIAVFMALRTFGSGPTGSVLYGTRKGLDSVCFDLPDKNADAAFQTGQDALYEHLFPVRGSAFEEMVSHAFKYVTEHVDEVRIVP